MKNINGTIAQYPGTTVNYDSTQTKKVFIGEPDIYPKPSEYADVVKGRKELLKKVVEDLDEKLKNFKDKSESSFEYALFNKSLLIFFNDLRGKCPDHIILNKKECEELKEVLNKYLGAMEIIENQNVK